MQSESSSSFAEYHQGRTRSDTLVILGPQGSGTNLLAKILGECFGIKPLLDRSLIFDAACAISEPLTQASVDRQFRFVMNKLKPGSIRRRFSLKHYHRIGHLFSGIEAVKDNFPINSTPEFVDLFYSYAAYKSQSAMKAVKSDDMWVNLAHGPRVLGPARYILLLRDPRDNAYSMINKNFGPCHIHAAAKYTRDRLDCYRSYFETRANSSDLVVKYEDLLQNPLKFCTDFAERYDVKPHSLPDEALENVNIRHNNHCKWMKLKDQEIAICEEVLRDDITRFGYPLSNVRPLKSSAMQRLRWTLLDSLYRGPQKIRRAIDAVQGR